MAIPKAIEDNLIQAMMISMTRLMSDQAELSPHWHDGFKKFYESLSEALV